jgi:beta-lactamase regulating signal transducer with metallopeptidase domain
MLFPGTAAAVDGSADASGMPHLQRMVEQVGWLLIHSVWQFAAVALLALVVDRCLRRAAATARYAMLLTAMLLIVLAPLCTWPFLPSARNEVASPIAQAPVAVPDVAEPHELSGDGEIVLVDEEPVGMLPSTTNHVPPSPLQEMAASEQANEPSARPWSVVIFDALHPWLSLIVGAWCVGVLLFSIRPAWSWCVVRRLKSVSVSPVVETVQQAFGRMCEQLQVARRVRVLQSTLVAAPVVVGCFRSVVLLPASFIAGVPVSQLEAILAHELAHVRRYDYLVNLLQTLVQTLFFYHPAVWWLSHRIRVERENCCDDLVVAALGNKIEYGRALLAVEQFCSTAVGPLVLGANDGSLLSRVKRLFATPPGHDQRTTAGLISWPSLPQACWQAPSGWRPMPQPARTCPSPRR